MNRSDIRNAVFAQLDWAPTQGTNAVSRVNEFIQRSVDLLSLEAPYLFHERVVHLWTQGDLTKAGGLDLCGVSSTDSFVITKDLDSLAAQTTWPGDNTLDGRWIEIKDTGDVWRRRQVRTAFLDNKGGGGLIYGAISLMRPWPNITETSGMDWRIYNPDYPLPHDVIEVDTVRIWAPNTQTEAPLTVLDQTEAEDWHLIDSPQNNVTGAPRAAVRRKQEAPIPAPQNAPTVGTATEKTNWEGTTWTADDELPGEFSYKITYAWGYRDDETASPTLSIKEPRWESAPSPASSTITTDVGSLAPELSLPNLDFMQGFGNSTTPRYQRSGFYIRIWRRRYSTREAPAINPDRQRGEVSDAYFLVGTANGYDGKWIDTATKGDYHRRLSDIHSYQSLALYPRPDQRYELTVRCIHRPPKLEDDSDAPLIYPEAINILVDRTLALVYEMQGNLQAATMASQRYDRGLRLLAKRYASLRAADRPIQKLPARKTPQRNQRSRNARRWYRLPN